MRLLLIEDNQRLSDALKRTLITDGYAVDIASDGQEGQLFAETTPYDVIILDVMLPKQDGLTLCRRLRDQGLNTPIVMLTARDAVDDRVRGLDSGADDYLVKPFAPNELQARLRALLRRTAPTKSSVLVVGDLTADPATHLVERAGQAITLTTKEYA